MIILFFDTKMLIYLSVQRTAKTCFIIFLQTRIIVDGAKNNGHDSGGHFFKYIFKNSRCKKNSHILVINLNLQVILSLLSL